MLPQVKKEGNESGTKIRLLNGLNVMRLRQRLDYLGHIFTLLLLVGLGYGIGVIPIRITQELPTADIRLDQGHAFLTPVGVDAAPTFGPAPNIELLENGAPLGSRNDFHREIRERGGGLYSHWSTSLYFSTGDNSDPTKNGRRYSIRYSPPIPVVFATLFFVLWGLTNVRTVSVSLKRIDTLNPAICLILLATLTALYRGWIWYANRDATFDGVVVKGVPFSDARCWDTLAREFGLGERGDWTWIGWAARRPGYYWFFGSLYALTGSSLFIMQFVKLLFAIAGSFLIYDALRRIAPGIVALLAALSHIFLRVDALDGISARSEGLGYFFTNLTFWFFVIGFDCLRSRSEPEKSWYYFVFGGIALAFANLSRPLNMGAIFVLPAVLLWALPQNFLELKNDFRRFVLPGLIFAGTAVATVAPWIIRQWIVYRIPSISDNSAEMLYAALSPEHGSWSSAIMNIAPGTYDKVAEHYRFFSEKIPGLFAENWRFYLHNAASKVGVMIEEIQGPEWFFIIAVVFGFVLGVNQLKLSKPKSALKFLVLASIVGLAVFFPKIRNWSWVLGGAFALVIRHPIALVLGLITPSIAALGVVAFSESRLLYGMIWQAVALTVWLPLAIVSSGESLVTYRRWSGPWVRFAKTLAVSLLCIWCVGAVTALARVKSFSVEEVFSTVTDHRRDNMIDATLRDPSCAQWEELRDILRVRIASVRPDYTRVFGAGEDVGHWSRIFKPRPYPFTIFETVPRVPGMNVLGPGDLSNLSTKNQYAFVGVHWTHDAEPTFELLNYLQLDENGNILSQFHCGGLDSAARQHAEKLLELRRTLNKEVTGND